jgi:polyhydroxybutyrate depolymerase
MTGCRLTRAAAVAGAVMALGAAVTACSAASSTPSASGAASAPAVAATRGASTASGTSGTSGGACAVSGGAASMARTMDVDGRMRTFIEHVPPGLGSGSKVPAIIAFPGRGESAAELESYSQLDGTDAIVLYLQALDGAGGQPSWEATPYQSAAAHDYDFTADVVNWLESSPCVDVTRIDMTGKSDGAGFAASAACVTAGVAAVATVSAAFYENDTRCGSSGRPVSVLNMHGTSDPVIPYNGSAEQGLFGTGGWIRLWLQHDQCPGSAANSAPAAQVAQASWSSCAGGTAVVNDTVTGGGHTWPGATVTSGQGPQNHTLNAAQAIAAFFAAHPLSSS